MTLRVSATQPASTGKHPLHLARIGLHTGNRTITVPDDRPVDLHKAVSVTGRTASSDTPGADEGVNPCQLPTRRHAGRR